MNKAKFITFEGGEGAGKSTQSKKLYEYLISRNIKVIHTREIGGTPEAEKIRDLIIHSDLYQLTELMLVMAARYEHIRKVIIPALLNNTWVICDRFIDSTAAYQGGNSELSITDIFDLHHKLMSLPSQNKAIMPDITFFIDISPDIGIKRSLATMDINKFESKDMHFHNEVYNRFKEIAHSQKDRVKIIDCTNQNEQEIHQKILEIVSSSYDF